MSLYLPANTTMRPRHDDDGAHRNRDQAAAGTATSLARALFFGVSMMTGKIIATSNIIETGSIKPMNEPLSDLMMPLK